MSSIKLLILVLIQSSTAFCMYIPQDVEIWDALGADESPELYSHELATKNLPENYGFGKPIRNKRSSYKILESSGLHSHFRLTDQLNLQNLQDINLQNTKNARPKRSVEEPAPSNSEHTQLPEPEKQVMGADFYRKNAWNVQPFENDYSRFPSEGDDNVMTAEATVNEGIRGRTPRVNFITQSKKSNDIDTKAQTLFTRYSPDVGGKPYEKMEARTSDFTGYPSRSYEPYLRRYDRYDDQYNHHRYDPYYEDYYIYRRRYDPYDSYSPRTPEYPEPYYDYPDRRYDIPEPRDYHPLYSNDIYDQRHSAANQPALPPSAYPKSSVYQPYPSYAGNRNRRIIYYAHLPEIVRTPQSVDLTYRYGKDRFSGTTGSYTGSMAAVPYQEENSKYSRDSAAFMKREKKDFRNAGSVPIVGKGSSSPDASRKGQRK